jgi:DNA-binding response OmpR family regulator
MTENTTYILLVDDDEEDLEMISSGLEMKGLKVKTLDSSAKALSYLTLLSSNSNLPSLIILDYNMPKNNGQQILCAVKENRVTKNIAVVMYSSGMSAILKIQLLTAGALDCFDKPWSLHDLDCQLEKFQQLASAI